MNLENLLIALSQNYRIEPHLLTMIKILISEANVTDYKKLLDLIITSKKFDLLSKVYDAIDKCKIEVSLTTEEIPKVQTYSDKLFSKTTSVFDEIDYQVSIGKDINSTQMTNFIYANFDDKERAVLKQIGDRNRLLFMIRGMREALREQINKIVEDLSLEKKKTVLGLSMTQKTDNEKKMLELMNKGKK
jgi:hypothetical protein